MSTKFSCASCGGVMTFDPANQALKCDNCDSVMGINNIEGAVQEHAITGAALNAAVVKERESHIMECSGCGAMMDVSATSTATKCPYCDSDYVLSDKQIDTVVPDGIIPFKFGKKDANNRFANWVKGLFWAPNKLKHMYKQDKIQGVYVPFWTFDADAYGNYTAQGGTEHTRTVRNSEGKSETERFTTWEHTHGQVAQKFDDCLVPASEKLEKSLIKRFASFNTNTLMSYSPEYLSGYNAECYTVDLNTAHHIAHEQMREELQNLAREDVLKRYDDVSDVRLDAMFNSETYKHVILPVYATAFTYSNKLYSVLINGQTGEIQGQYPKSVVKIALAVAGVIALALIIFNMLG